MMRNRSAPSAAVIPILVYPDVRAAVEWLQTVFGFVERVQIDYEYGERQYETEDLAGHRWTFSQTLRDVAPEEWGGISKG